MKRRNETIDKLLKECATPAQLKTYNTLYARGFKGSAIAQALRILEAEWNKKQACRKACCNNETRLHNVLVDKALSEKNIYKKYNLSHKDYLKLHKIQSSRCAICFTQTKLCVDHDHSTGRVRGLLCRHCNSGIGFLKDDVNNLKQAINYLS